jgi:hypothetical protein
VRRTKPHPNSRSTPIELGLSIAWQNVPWQLGGGRLVVRQGNPQRCSIPNHSQTLWVGDRRRTCRAQEGAVRPGVPHP